MARLMDVETRTSSRRKLVLLAAIAFVPLFIAYGLFFFAPDWKPEGTKNHGQLIQPPLDATELETPTRQWSLLVMSGPECDARCSERLYLTRQIHTALGKDADRLVRRWVRSTPVNPSNWASLKAEHPDLEPWISETLERTLSDYASAELSGMRVHVFLADPLGNIMMAYPESEVGKPLLEDLRLLLKLSKLG